MRLLAKTNNYTEGWHSGTRDKVAKHKDNLNKCINALANERERVHIKFTNADTGKKFYGTKPKKLKELLTIKHNCEQWGQKSPIQYLEAFAHTMDLPNPDDDRKPEPTTPTMPAVEEDMYN